MSKPINMRVVCKGVSKNEPGNGHNNTWKKGKVYDVVDGVITDEGGYSWGEGHDCKPFTSLIDLIQYFQRVNNHGAQFRRFREDE